MIDEQYSQLMNEIEELRNSLMELKKIITHDNLAASLAALIALSPVPRQLNRQEIDACYQLKDVYLRTLDEVTSVRIK